MAKTRFSQPVPQNQTQHHCYNDGLLHFGKVSTIRDEATKEKIGEIIEECGMATFAKATIRESDNVIAESLGYTIDLKVRVPRFEESTDCKVKINQKFLNDNNETIYDIIKKDIGLDKQVYLYLQIVSRGKCNDE